MEIITPEVKAANRIEFDRVTSLLMGQGTVVSKIKNEIITVRSKYMSMLEILSSYPTDHISTLEKSLYDVQAQAFIHAVYMYASYKDPQGNPYIQPVAPGSFTTDVSLTIKYPHYTVTTPVAVIDNMTIDIYNWDIYEGTMVINALKSEELSQQFSTVVEYPEPYFSRTEFITGIRYEVEKLMLFNSQICRLEQIINSGLRYVSELKNIGLYN